MNKLVRFHLYMIQCALFEVFLGSFLDYICSSDEVIINVFMHHRQSYAVTKTPVMCVHLCVKGICVVWCMQVYMSAYNYSLDKILLLSNHTMVLLFSNYLNVHKFLI